MDLETLENMGDEEMAGKIGSIAAILKVLGNNMLGRILASPLKFAKLTKFSLKIKKEIGKIKDEQDKEKQLDSSITVMKMILDYKNTNPQEFDTLFEILEDMVHKYQANPNVKQDVLRLIGYNSDKQ